MSDSKGYLIYGKVDSQACDIACHLLRLNDVKHKYKILNVHYSIEDLYTIMPRSHNTFPLIFKGGEYLGGLKQLKDHLGVSV